MRLPPETGSIWRQPKFPESISEVTLVFPRRLQTQPELPYPPFFLPFEVRGRPKRASGALHYRATFIMRQLALLSKPTSCSTSQPSGSKLWSFIRRAFLSDLQRMSTRASADSWRRVPTTTEPQRPRQVLGQAAGNGNAPTTMLCVTWSFLQWATRPSSVFRFSMTTARRPTYGIAKCSGLGSQVNSGTFPTKRARR